MNYSANECKLIKIVLEKDQTFFMDKRTIRIEVPMDFVPNNKWYIDQIRKYHIDKCESWIKMAGFTKDDNGKFSIMHKQSSKTVTLPPFFYDRGKKDLYIGFNNVMGLSEFRLPGSIEAKNGWFIPLYDTYENFPRKMDGRLSCSASFDRWNDIEFEFYKEHVPYNTGSVEGEKEGILGDYYKLLFRYVVMNDRDLFDTFKWPVNFKKSITQEDWNWAESSLSVKKYQL